MISKNMTKNMYLLKTCLQIITSHHNREVLPIREPRISPSSAFQRQLLELSGPRLAALAGTIGDTELISATVND